MQAFIAAVACCAATSLGKIRNAENLLRHPKEGGGEVLSDLKWVAKSIVHAGVSMIFHRNLLPRCSNRREFYEDYFLGLLGYRHTGRCAS